ncbi:hypothetical protein T265_15253, partial [Opisthorchis viverrini]
KVRFLKVVPECPELTQNLKLHQNLNRKAGKYLGKSIDQFTKSRRVFRFATTETMSINQTPIRQPGFNHIGQGSKTLVCILLEILCTCLLLERVFLNFPRYSVTIIQRNCKIFCRVAKVATKHSDASENAFFRNAFHSIIKQNSRLRNLGKGVGNALLMRLLRTLR